MRLRFKSLLSFIFLLIAFCIFLGIGYIFYDKINTDSDIYIDGDITINYLSGKSFELQGDKEIVFSVTNNSLDTLYYYLQLKNIDAKDVSYVLTSSEDLKIENKLKSEIISNQVAINAQETVNYKIKFITKNDEIYKGSLEIGQKTNENDTFASLLLANNKLNETSLTNNGEAATLDEGFLKSTDDLGVCYYFRGAVTNNNVKFAGKNWKIVKINGDGSVKIILDDIVDELDKYYVDDYEFKNSNIYNTLDTWYNEVLDEYSDYIAYYKFCNDNILEEESLNYIAYNRIIVNKIPMYVCLGDSVNSKIGLLTADEASLAGASISENKSFYLYNENITSPYFLMTGSLYKNGEYYPFLLSESGSLTFDVSGKLLRGIRPVINIIKNAKVTGVGTNEEPYELIID